MPDATSAPATVLTWLLDSDPAIRWQVLRDLADAPEAEWSAERERVASHGWGRAILGARDRDGRWAGGLYRPHWTGTTYTLDLLERMGLPAGHPDAVRAVRILLDGARYTGGGFTYPDSTARYPEACITSLVVRLAAAFGVRDPRVDAAVGWLLTQPVDDGGWNCERDVTGSRHGSFHTTVSCLEGLAAYQAAGGGLEVAAALAAGREFLLAHRLFRSHRTGQVADGAVLQFPFPPRWRYDVLRGLEHFRSVEAPRDDRLAEAVAVVRKAAGPDGRWPRFAPLPGPVWVDVDGENPSRWSTLRALRVLRWWEASRSG